jgi:cell division septation protein DedD
VANGKNPKTVTKKPPAKRIRPIPWGRYAGVVLIAAWMFGLGVLVGRGTAPVSFDIHKLTRELEGLIATDQKERLEPVAVEADDAKTKTELEFYEELKKSGPIAPHPQPDRTATSPTPKALASPSDREKKTPAVGQKPSDAKKTVPKPEQQSSPGSADARSRAAKADPVRPTDTPAYLTVQAASLKGLNEADALVEKLKNRGYPAYKTIALVPGKGIWFRIRVGRYGSRKAAGDVLGRLKQEGYRPILVETN